MVRRLFTLSVALALAGSTLADAAPKKAAVGDLDGLWTTASYTRLQRPRAIKTLVLTPEEAKNYEATLAKYNGVPDNPKDEIGQNDSEFPDSGDGLAVINGEYRSSWIVDPADGRVPYTDEARKKLGIGDPNFPEVFDNPEDRPQGERCLTASGSSPPILSAQDTNLLQIVQTPDHVALLSERNNVVRIVPIGVARDPRTPVSWSGDSIGHWEGKTLVVETQGFKAPIMDRDFFLHSDKAVIVERFTRIGPDEIRYDYTVTDPTMYKQPWRAEALIKRAKGPLFEYACHEGNYAIVNALTAARVGRQSTKAADEKKRAEEEKKKAAAK